MSRLNHVEITLGLSWLVAGACGGTAMGPEEMIQQFDPITGTTPNSPSKPSAAGSTAAPSIVRASAQIEPLVVAAAPAMSANTSTGEAGMSAASAGTGESAAAGAGAAGTSSSAGTGGQTGMSAGSGGTGTGAGIAAGSGGEAGSSTAAAGTGGEMSAAGSGAAMMAEAGSAAAGDGATAPSTGAAGEAGMADPGKAGAGGVEAPANIMGSANFASNPSGVSLTVMVSGCQSGKEYPIHLHQGSSCESAMAQGGHWDMTRGEGIPNIRCGGRQGATTVMRANTDATTAWSVGDASASDVVGHTVVIHDADDPTVRIACGVIMKN